MDLKAGASAAAPASPIWLLLRESFFSDALNLADLKASASAMAPGSPIWLLPRSSEFSDA
jgi:hypothetical protein